jgi:Rrf2 family protein
VRVKILDKFSKVFYPYFMLRLSTKGQYGVRAMFEIAQGYPDKPVPIKEIAERQAVSVAYLEQILNKLKNGGLIKSIKGPGGGYLLSMKPERISISAILKELEGPVAITSCLDPDEGCVRVDGCVTYMLWKSLGEKIDAFLGTVTLRDLIKGTLLSKPKAKSLKLIAKKGL